MWMRAAASLAGVFISLNYVAPTGIVETVGVLAGVLGAALAAEAFVHALRSHRRVVISWTRRALVFGTACAMLLSYLAPITPTSASAVVMAALICTIVVERAIGTARLVALIGRG